MNSAITLVKRGFRLLGCLFLLFVFGIGGIGAYLDHNPETKERLEISERMASREVDRDAGFFARAGAWVSAWWVADELVADAREEKALAEKERAERRKEAQSRSFNDSQYSYNDDYYPDGN